MNLAKNVEKEVLHAYDIWLHSYLNGDVKTYDSYFDDAFHFIGSTANEEFLNRQDTTTFFGATAEQLSGKSQLRNETKIVEKFGELIFITHLFDAWFLNGEEWNFYERFRFTNILQQKEGEWRFVYQHYSTPDSKAQEGQTIGFEQISAENLQLREAIQRRTKELEEKNRELKVESALERIRAQAVAMREPSDLLDIVVTMRNEFTRLGHEAQYFWHMMWLEKTYEKAMTSGDGTKIGFVMELPRHIHGDIPLVADWEKSDDPILIYPMVTKAAIAYVDKMITLGNFKQIDPQAPTQEDIKKIGGLTFVMARTAHGEIGFSLPGVVKNPPQEDMDMLVKFAKAFDLAHQRFLDLQKAEAQAREAKIEHALEKVRSRTMAMQHSDELPEAANLLFTEVQKLGIPAWSCGYNILSDDKKSSTCIMSSEGELQSPFVLPLTAHKSLEPWYKAIINNEDFFVYGQDGKDLVEHYEYMKSLPELKSTFEQFENVGLDLPTQQYNHLVRFNEGFLLFITYGEVSEAHDIFKRFGKVFEQTYTRFLDLQKAEAQARESEIELGLERLRAKAMAMQSSNELSDLVATLLNELTKLDFSLTFCIINIYNEADLSNTVWAANPEEGKAPESYYMKFEDYPFHHAMMREWKAQTPKFVYVMEGEEKEIYDDYLFTETEFRRFPKEVQDANRALDKYVASFVFSPFGGLQTVGDAPLSDESLDILYRFGKVFNQTYTRFLDLQKAEAQAWEAKIESSLEKIRNVALSLKRSDEMLDIAQVLYEQLQVLGFKDIRNALIDINDEETETFMDYDYSDLMGGTVTQMAYDDDPTLKEQLQDIAKTTDGYSEMVLQGQQLQDLINMRKKNGEADDPRLEAATSVSYILYAFGNGAIGISNFGKLNENQKAVLDRFRNVFTFAYNRYSELAKAEYQMQEVQLEASLEKVRSVALSMQKRDDMLDIAKILFEQLQELGFSEIRNTIIDVHNDDNETFWDYDYSEAMGGTIVLLSYKNDPTLEEQYRKIISTTDGFYEEIIEGDDLKEYIEMRIRNGEQDDPRLRKVDLLSYYLYSFGNGVIGISNFGVLNEDKKAVLERFRNVFTFAYKRYEEIVQAQVYLTNLQKAKKSAEKALNELQTTQQQLIQAEKMASLGELTAGIAHEIQNPLNFVNNFSEVSNELMDEMNEEIEKGDLEEAKLIANDIKQNLEKINHHGKRADGIVKGMLQHSRRSTAQKEPTDINKLTDEYLRLAYHGLRAKDKTFNATLETHFDESIGKINIIPQDMGRVILNLITNAFYAVNEKMKSLNNSEFQPRVTVSTQNNSSFESASNEGGTIQRNGLKEGVIISIKDNGNGIPNDVLDKIFQPFFTTKPTGKGTGLGLSMSYDIVKAHGGTLHVDTELGKGTQFSIEIPIKQEV